MDDYLNIDHEFNNTVVPMLKFLILRMVVWLCEIKYLFLRNTELFLGKQVQLTVHSFKKNYRQMNDR